VRRRFRPRVREKQNAFSHRRKFFLPNQPDGLRASVDSAIPRLPPNALPKAEAVRSVEAGVRRIRARGPRANAHAGSGVCPVTPRRAGARHGDSSAPHCADTGARRTQSPFSSRPRKNTKRQRVGTCEKPKTSKLSRTLRENTDVHRRRGARVGARTSGDSCAGRRGRLRGRAL